MATQTQRKPAWAGRKPKACREHCIVWAVAMDGWLALICAHCKHVTKKIDLSETYEPDLLMRQCKRSQKAHQTHCIRLKRS